jgi:hypothetical protein
VQPKLRRQAALDTPSEPAADSAGPTSEPEQSKLRRQPDRDTAPETTPGRTPERTQESVQPRLRQQAALDAAPESSPQRTSEHAPARIKQRADPATEPAGPTAADAPTTTKQSRRGRNGDGRLTGQ